MVSDQRWLVVGLVRFEGFLVVEGRGRHNQSSAKTKVPKKLKNIKNNPFLPSFIFEEERKHSVRRMKERLILVVNEIIRGLR
ncbi:hypothetical protein H5410_033115 [Solanum commersonii]|uniref:Uncharacterized protein n=1 Tax=Solanum commersonii TaxID=4109 RepID=A0A9J5YMW3_SOLCO|nr:hypothetical protein H5410_033115 [Solanum commersonii]